MIVFKNYLKIVKAYIPTLILYTAIFLLFAVVSSLNTPQIQNDYETEKANIAFISYDDSQFINDFKNYIAENSHLVEIDKDEESLKDALFFRKVDFIMIIPKDFTKNFMEQKDVSIQTMQVPDAYFAIYSQKMMNRYLNTAQLYIQADMNQETLSQKVQEDLNQKAIVHINKNIENHDLELLASYYNFANYTLLAIIITVVSMVMISFRDEKIKKRNLISPISSFSLNKQLLFGNIIVSMIVLLIYITISFILYTDAMMSIYGCFFILNSFSLLVFILILSFFISQLTNNRELISGISNVISLGSSFLAGAFVPQQYLSPFVLKIAHILPSYWFIKNNNEIAVLKELNSSTIIPIMMRMLIILLFTLFFYILIQHLERIKSIVRKVS